MLRNLLAPATTTLAALVLAAPASGVELTPVGSFDTPVYVTSEPGAADRLYVVEQDGRIQLVTGNGTVEFADLTGEVVSTAERGLLSMAFPPDFAASRLVYVYYTGAGGSLRVGEMRVEGETADEETLRNVIRIPHPDPNHNGGQIQFGPDGYLYLAPGDGGGSGDPGENGQDLGELLGKMLRIDPRRSGGQDYTVPPDNPFVGGPGADEIWSYGLRNPFRFSFDRLTGDLTIGDVGQDSWEEIDFAPLASGGGRGVNWGWDCREGAHPFPETNGCMGPAAPTDPVIEYPNDAARCAVTGGYVVRDPGLTELFGRYLYTDTCGRQIRSATLASPRVTDDSPVGLSVRLAVSFGEDACGRIYVVSLEGAVSRFVDGTPTDCSPVLPPPDPVPLGRCGPIVLGGDGDDSLRGGAGDQDVIGLGGNDLLRGEAGADCVEGRNGGDVVRGGDGRDILLGGTGRDEIRARDGERDTVACGPGMDRFVADRADRVRGCERPGRR